MPPTLQILLWVFIGGSLGSLARELVTPLLPAPQPWLPTLVINVAASFVLGCLYPLRHRIKKYMLHLAAVGFCGGFSTFSHFIEEIMTLTSASRYSETGIYLGGSVAAAICAAALGEAIMQAMVRNRP